MKRSTIKKRQSCYRLAIITAMGAAAVTLPQSIAVAGNTALVFKSGSTNLLSSASYTPAAVPGVANDVEFSTYPSTASITTGINTASSFGSIDDVDTNPYSVYVSNSNNGSSALTLTLGGSGDLGDSVSGSSPTDLLYVTSGANLVLQSANSNGGTGVMAVTLGTSNGSNGTLDIAGTATIQGIIGGTSGLTKTGAGTLILWGANTYTGTSTVNANISAGVLEIATGTALGSATSDVNIIGSAELYCYDNGFIPSYASSFSSGRTFNLSSATSTIKVGGTETWAIDGPIVGTGILNVSGPGTLELNDTTSGYAASYGGGPVNGGTPTSPSTNILSGTLDINVLKNLPQGQTSIYSGATFEYGATSSTAQYSSNTTFNLAGGNDTMYFPTAGQVFTMFGAISGTGSLVKTGYSTLVLENTTTFTGAINISGGSTLSLDYTSSASANALYLGSTTASSTFNTLGLNSAAATANTVGNFLTSITTILNTNLLGGGDSINIGNFNTSSLTIGLGAINRSTGSTLNLTLPSVGTVTTTTANAIFTGGQQTILGGYATVSGSTWAVSGTGATAGVVSGLTAYNTSFGAGSDVDALASITPSVSSINSLRFNTTSSVTVTLASPLSVATGGVLETANVGSGASLITGSNLTSGNGTDLIVSQYNTIAPLTIASQITGTIGLTKSGPGSVLLTGGNTYTGGTVIDGGTVGIASDSSLGAVPVSAVTNITLAGAGATLQIEAPVNLSTTRSLLIGIAGGAIDTNGNAFTSGGSISGTGALTILNTGGASTGVFNLATTGTITTGTLALGSAAGGANFSVAPGFASTVSFTTTSLAGGSGDSISAGNFNTSSYNLSLGAISRSAGSTVNFTLPTTGNITTTTVNSSFPQGQQTILGGYATVNGTTWAVSGSGATAGIITGLTNYDTNFDGNTDVDVTSVTPTSVSTNYINSLRFNIAAPYTLTLGSPVSFSANMSAVSLYIASGGILETSNVGANADSITSGVLSTSNGTDLIVIQNNVAAPLTISSQIVNFNTSGVNLGLTKAGPGTLIISGANTYTGTTIVNGGTLALGAIGALPSGNNLTVDGGASLVETNLGTTTSMYVGKLVDDGKIDLANNGLVVHSGTLAAVTALVAGGYNNGGWNGSTGIVSSAASSDTTYLTAVGVIVNDNGSGTALYGSGGTLNSTFNGITPVDGDILVKYTYYGDTNLDGAVDGSDYTNIDNGFHNQLTGWINGDFNYDGVVDGSDYTLIDNAYNMQGPSLGSNPASLIASNTAQIAGASAVPEPTAMSLISAAATGLLTRRRRQR